MAVFKRMHRPGMLLVGLCIANNFPLGDLRGQGGANSSGHLCLEKHG